MAARLRDDTPIYCSFLVFKARPAWHALSPPERTAVAERVEQVLTSAPVRRRGFYSLVGLREDADLLLWAAADRVDDLQDLAARLALAPAAPTFAALFETAAVYLAVAKVSPYTGAHVPAFRRGIPPQRFLIMYPFVKTPEWYLLPFEERRRLMEEHGRVGGQWPQVFTNTLYAFGLGDYEFVVAFETEHPADFLALLERLREVEVRRYTLRDTPIYLAARKPFWGVWQDLGVRPDRTNLLLIERPETLAALGEGRQATVLRRGGSKENAFGAVGDTVLLAAEADAGVAHLAGRVEAAFDVTEPAHLESLERVHPEAIAEARDRFQWRGPAQALRALVLRVGALPPASLPPILDRFGDWAELQAGVRIDGGSEVLDDVAFAARLAAVREALRAETVEA
ncbi:MAG: chlorite dismutase family protein [Armatimonadetes bacterium]|nr:chlorite dismutase family protein [Armatimonadota bacterium]